MVYPTLILLTIVFYSLYAAWDFNRERLRRRDYDLVGKFSLKFWRYFGLFHNN